MLTNIEGWIMSHKEIIFVVAALATIATFLLAIASWFKKRKPPIKAEIPSSINIQNGGENNTISIGGDVVSGGKTETIVNGNVVMW